MNQENQIDQLMRWHLDRVVEQAPPAPRASRLLEMARPWWEISPAQFLSLANRLSRMHVAYGHAMPAPRQGRGGHEVAVLLVNASGEQECIAQALYLDVGVKRLRFRFLLEASSEPGENSFEATFVSNASALPLFAAVATLSVNNEYSVVADISPELAGSWASLKVTDVMPFSLILRRAAGNP